MKVEWGLLVSGGWGKCWLKLQSFNYKMNNFQGSNALHDDYR